MTHGHNIRQGNREGFPVLDHACQRHTAHIHAMIGPLAADKAQTLSLAVGAVISHHNLHRRFN